MSPKATIPTKGSRLAAGHDLYAINKFIIPSQGQVLAETGIAIGLPKGTYARIAPRSGLASKKGIAINGGVIDADYTGEIKVIMSNHGKLDCRIQTGLAAPPPSGPERTKCLMYNKSDVYSQNFPELNILNLGRYLKEL